jgi:hypothetical protein
MKNNIMILYLGSVLCATIVFGQERDFSGQDSAEVSDHMEQLVEQGGDIEDSPIIEFLSDEQEKHTRWLQFRSRIVQRLQLPAGYDNGTYLGSPATLYHRMKFTAGTKISGGVLVEKDPGERKMNDFMSGNIFIRETGLFSKIILGDFLVESGQGIALWRGFDASKGADIISPVLRKSRGVAPYLSSEENAFFRGVALQANIQHLSVDVFYSNRKRAATLNDKAIVTSFYTAGYFRTEHEEAKRSSVSERLFGAVTRYQISEDHEVGVTLYKTLFSNSLVVSDENEDIQNHFSMASLNYTIGISAATLFGEWAKSGANIGGMSGLFFQPLSPVKIIGAIRRYPSGFVSLHGFGFGERAGMNNEHGMYCGISLKPAKHITLTGYADQFSFPEPRGISQFPSHGSERFLQLNVNSFNRLSLALRYVVKRNDVEKVVQGTNGFMTKKTLPEFRNTMRLQFEYDVNKEIRLRVRYERVHAESEFPSQDERGMLVFQDVVFMPNERLRCDARMVYFQTDSYASRVYEYENDLEGVLSLPVLYGRGLRWYLMVKYDISSFFKISIKYSELIRDDIKRIGSGAERLPSNHDNRIGVQIDVEL